MQASHAALEAGLKDTNQYQQTSSIIIFQIPDEQTLKKELNFIESLGIQCASFYEPYENTGITAFATLPITESKRHIFKDYTLWGRDFKQENPELHQYLKQEKKQIKAKKSVNNMLEQTHIIERAAA